MATMYQRRSRLTKRQQNQLMKYFVSQTTARAAASILQVQPNTAITFFMRLRKLIASHLPRYDLSGEMEADESYFGGVRKGRGGRAVPGKITVFGLLKRGGKVYTAIIPNAQIKTLIPIITEKVHPDSIVYTDAFPVYNALDITTFRHERINHSKHFARGRNHINGIENFWSQAKRHLRRFNGIKKENFYWFLKECEWRFNSRSHQKLLTQLKYWYKSSHH